MAKPRPIGFQVKQSTKPFNGKTWRVEGYVDGQRKIYWFADEDSAKADCKDRNEEMQAYGSKVNLDSEARLEAFRAAELLQPYGKTIMHAVHFYAAHLNKMSSSVPFAALAVQVRSEFSRRLEKNEVSERHDESLRETLKKMEAHFGERMVSDILTGDVRSWLIGLPLATKTRNKHRGYAAQIFNLGKDFGYTQVNPVTTIKRFRERVSEENDEISALSSEQTEKLFRAADPSIIPYLTLSFFAGIRRATVERLDWSDLHFDEKRVVVPAYAGKKQKRYGTTLSENALAWLKPYIKNSGSLLAPARATNRPGAAKGAPSVVGTRNLILKAAEKAGVKLPDNAGRNTFISMHIAHYQNIGTTATEANTSIAKIKEYYLDLVTRKDAAKFWKIYPAK
jgi:integrase